MWRVNCPTSCELAPWSAQIAHVLCSIDAAIGPVFCESLWCLSLSLPSPLSLSLSSSLSVCLSSMSILETTMKKEIRLQDREKSVTPSPTLTPMMRRPSLPTTVNFSFCCKMMLSSLFRLLPSLRTQPPPLQEPCLQTSVWWYLEEKGKMTISSPFSLATLTHRRGWRCGRGWPTTPTSQVGSLGCRSNSS